MNRNQARVAKLSALLRQLIDAYTRYALLLKEEESTVTKFEILKTEQLTHEREKTGLMIQDGLEQLMEFRGQFPEFRGKKITDLVIIHWHKDDVAAVMPLLNQLKQVAIATKKQTTEFSQIVNFAQRILSGTISILYSATQTITRGYTKQGVVKEKLLTNNSRPIERA